MIYGLPRLRANFRRGPVAALGVVVALVILLEFQIFETYRQLHEATDDLRRSQSTLIAIGDAVKGIVNVETGERGFLIAGDESFLEPYVSGRAQFDDGIRRAIALSESRPEQRSRLEKVRDVEVGWRTRVIEPAIAQRRALAPAEGNVAAAQDIVRSGIGKSYVDRMRALLREAESAEQARIALNNSQVETFFWRSTVFLMAGSGAVLVLVIALSAMLALNLRILSRANERLEHEVAERKEAEMQVRQGRDRLDLALDGAGLALWDWNLATGDVYLGPRWNEILGGARKETMTRIADLERLIHPEDAQRVKTLVRDTLRGMIPEYRAEHRVRTLLGEWKWIESHGKVVARGSGAMALRIAGTNADISKRKRIDRMKNEFVATVSHELRTPLTAIIGGLGIIKDDMLGSIPPPARPFLDMAYQNSERLRDLINNILDMEKIESGLMNFRNELIDPEPLLQKAVDLNRPYAEQLGVRFAFDAPAGRLRIHADPDRLMQVLTNLLSNAAKFSPRHETVTLSCRQYGERVHIEVRDRGPGIPEEFRDRIFGKFAQADSSDTREKGGTGLGLSIAKALVEKMRGRIGFESEPGEGSTFYVELPTYPEPADVTAAIGPVV